MIELTKDEAVDLLTSLSRIDGHLLSTQANDSVYVQIEFCVELLVDKLKAEDK